MTSIAVLALLFAGGCLLTIGDIFQKEWIIRNNYWLFWIGILLYTMGGILLAICYRYKNMATATMIYIIFNVVTLVIISWLWYDEKLDMIAILGLVLGMVSVGLMEYSGK